MHITVKWFKDAFNVNLHSKEGVEEFLSIKGCRIVSGKNGPFVSFPASKKTSGEGYWNHVWTNPAFYEAVLKKAEESRPTDTHTQAKSNGYQPQDDDIPF